jgi:hypothetical protein
MPYPWRKRPAFSQSIFKLIGHAIGGAALFVSLAALTWALGVAVSALNSVHPFSADVLQLLHNVEIGLLYMDIGLSGIVLLVGAFRFVKEISGVSDHEDGF